jgi:hypothetical protein
MAPNGSLFDEANSRALLDAGVDMVTAHAEALGMTLVTNDVAIKDLAIVGLKIVSW